MHFRIASAIILAELRSFETHRQLHIGEKTKFVVIQASVFVHSLTLLYEFVKSV